MAKTPEFDVRENRKNYFINGDMTISQRNTTFASTANGAYTLDRFQYIKVGAMVHTVSQDTDVPTVAQSGYLFTNSLRLNLTTPDTSIAATDYCAIGQIIEGYNWKNLAQKPFTLGFWVKATLPGTYCIGMQNSSADRGYAAEYTVDAANIWEYKTITIPASVAAGTWNYTNGVGLKVWWSLAAGSNFHAVTGSWQTGTVLSTANQTNGVNTGATDFRLTGITINEGYEAYPFKLFNEDFEGELAACSRYYEKSYNIDVFPTAGSSSGQAIFNNNDSAGSRNPFFYIPFKVSKRTGVPVVTLYNPVTGATASARGSDGGNYTIDSLQVGNTGLMARIVSLPALVSGSVQFTSESELS